MTINTEQVSQNVFTPAKWLVEFDKLARNHIKQHDGKVDTYVGYHDAVKFIGQLLEKETLSQKHALLETVVGKVMEKRLIPVGEDDYGTELYRLGNRAKDFNEGIDAALSAIKESIGRLLGVTGE